MSRFRKRDRKNSEIDFAAATALKRQEFFERLHAEHMEAIAGAKQYGLDALAARSWMWASIAISAAECAPRCESPLEVALLAEIVPLVNPPSSYLSPMPEVKLECQKQIGQYRVDFFIQTKSYEGKDIRVVIEVDGHEFHEKTKEQAQRDKERDRFLVSSGCIVMRFTGSEVYKNAEGCAVEISNYIEKLHYRPEGRRG